MTFEKSKKALNGGKKVHPWRLCPVGPTNPLDSNVVKALIGSESEFDPNRLANPNNQNSARGLMQITNGGRKTLGDEKGEIKDHYVTATREELNDPNVNICAGIRWLFQKQKLATGYLGHEASWIETVENYKGLKNKSEADKKRLMGPFKKYLEMLAACKKIIFVFMLLVSFDLAYARTHLNLKSYPFALLTPDYGILNTNDLAINSCDAVPAPFSPESISYPYWQCFPTREISFVCDTAGLGEESKTEIAILLINITNKNSRQQYMPRRSMEMTDCKWFQKKWKEAIRHQKFACLSGPFSGYVKEDDREISMWVFDKFKTKRSCTSYFHSTCSLSYVKKHGCQI